MTAMGEATVERSAGLLRAVPALLAGLLTAFALASFAHYARHAFINADAWSVYDMARSLDERFYRIALIRQFVQPVEYGVSYPFVAPALVYLLDRLTGLGVYAHYLVSALAGWAALLLAYPVLRKAGGEGGSRAVALSALLLAVVAFGVEELYRDIYRASTIPIALALILTALTLVPAGGLGVRRAFAVGGVMGLAALTRFDVNLFVLAFVGAVAVAAGQRRMAAAAAYGAGVLLAVSPWIAYSLAVFGKPYVSDNALVAVAVRQLISYDLIPPGEPTLFTDPAGWLARIAFTARDFLAILERMLLGSPFTWAFLGGIIGLALLLPLWGRVRGRPVAAPAAPEEGGAGRYRRVLTAAAAAALLLFVGPVLTGYQMNTRYYSITFVLWALMLLAWAHAGMRAAERRLGHAGPRRVFEVAVTVLCLAGLPALPREALRDGWPPLAFDEANRVIDREGFFWRCVPADGRTLLLHEFSDRTLQDGMRFGVMARRSVVLRPNNWTELPAERRRAFLADLRVSHVLLAAATPAAGVVGDGVPLAPVDGCPGLYRLGAP
jgi:hypothetical protein